jgi:hypothetical protein
MMLQSSFHKLSSLLFLLCKHGKSATMIFVLMYKRIFQCCKYVCAMMSTLGTFIICTFFLLRTHTYFNVLQQTNEDLLHTLFLIAYTVSYCNICVSKILHHFLLHATSF